MIKNTDENMKKLEEYIDTRDFDEIKITDLVNYFAYKAGANVEVKKINRIENLVPLKKNVLFVLADVAHTDHADAADRPGCGDRPHH